MVVESLEPRRFLSGSPTIELTSCGVLVVTGTCGNDTLFITESDGISGRQFDVATQDETGLVPLASVPESMVKRVDVIGLDGADFLVLQTSGPVGGDVWGDGGSDEIHLQDDANALSTGHGGSGDDLIVIFAGRGTSAFGDSGNDTLISFEDTNLTLLFGGSGNDVLQGTDHTFMFGGAGHDTVTTT